MPYKETSTEHTKNGGYVATRLEKSTLAEDPRLFSITMKLEKMRLCGISPIPRLLFQNNINKHNKP